MPVVRHHDARARHGRPCECPRRVRVAGPYLVDPYEPTPGAVSTHALRSTVKPMPCRKPESVSVRGVAVAYGSLSWLPSTANTPRFARSGRSAERMSSLSVEASYPVM